MREINALKRQLSGLSTRCALICIIQKGGGDKQFIWAGKLWTPNQAYETLEEDILEIGCGSMGVLRFFGGPPGKGGWFDGTMLSMLCDLILFDEKTQNWTASEKLSA
ncbi:MAG: hypothetical protein ACYSUB_01775 [Planctomycetota bacterium]